MGNRDTWPSLHLPDLGVNCAAQMGAVGRCACLCKQPGWGFTALELLRDMTQMLVLPKHSWPLSSSQELSVREREDYDPTQPQGEKKQQIAPERLVVPDLGFWEVQPLWT